MQLKKPPAGSVQAGDSVCVSILSSDIVNLSPHPGSGECRFNRPVTGRLHASSQRKQSQAGRKYRRNGRLRETEKQRGSTSPSKVYAKREGTADFLLKEASVKSDSERSEIGLQLLGRLEDNSYHPEALGRLRVGGNVVNVNGFRSPNFAGAKCLAIDNRLD